jgi:hypothetical protein
MEYLLVYAGQVVAAMVFGNNFMTIFKIQQ